MAEIRRIHEDEGDAAAALWDEMCRTSADGAPLTSRGRRNIRRMLEMAAWHHSALCLVAIEDGQLIGFTNVRLDAGSGLLPGLVGEIDTHYVTPRARARGVSRRLAEAAIAELHGRGAGVLRNLISIDDPAAREFWQALGFTADMVCLSLYPSAPASVVRARRCRSAASGQ
jgi:GNAT superfamily N-acetyltransferase